MQTAEPGAGPDLLPAGWTTRRLLASDSRLEDVPQLTRLFNACSYVEPWDPTFRPVEERELRQLVEQSLATTTGVHQAFRLQRLQTRADGTLVGYFHLHHSPPRLPQPLTPFISMFVIHPDHQGQRLAQEAVAGLTEQLAHCGYAAIWLEVFLKNWPALRFWIRQGFTRIIEYDGARRFSEAEHATLVLEKRLSI